MPLRLALFLLPWVLLADAPSTRVWQKQYEQWTSAIANVRLENVQWSPSGERLAYSWRNPDGRNDFIVVDCATGKGQPAFEPEALAQALRAGIKPKADPRNLGVVKVVPQDDGKLWIEGGDFTCKLGPDGALLSSDATKADEAKLQQKEQAAGSDKQDLSGRRIARDAFIVGASNPKVAIFFSAVLPQFISSHPVTFL